MQQQQQHQKFEDSLIAPSFSCYTTNSTTSTAVAKVIREEQLARLNEDNGDVEGEDFEFSLVLGNAEVKEDEISASSAITGPLGKLFIGETQESYSYSSSEADELESPAYGTYCEWTSKADSRSSPSMTKCKKSSSTGSVSGSKRWIFRYLLKRSNSEGKKPMVLLNPKKVENQKQKRNSSEVSKVGGLWKSQTPVHEQFYVNKRAENEAGKRKSYLPYRKDLVGLFANVNGMGKMLPF